MATKSYEQMTKAELLKAISFFKLESKVAELGKDANSLINADYVKVLNAFRDSQAALNGAEDTNTNTNEEEIMADKVEPEVQVNFSGEENKVETKITPKAPVVPEPKKLTRDEEVALAAEYNLTKTRVVITDHDTTQSMEADVLERGVTISWGNKFLLSQTDCVFMHGEPQYVRNGALAAMKTILIPTNSKDSTNRTKARFSITEVEGWTQEKIDELKAQQKLKGN